MQIINKRIENFEKIFDKSSDIFIINQKHLEFLEQISKILNTNNNFENYTSTNNVYNKDKEKDVNYINPIIKLYEKLNLNIGKFFQKVMKFFLFRLWLMIFLIMKT